MDSAPRPLLLFDGHCALCDGTVRWLLQHDRGRLHYAPLQSAIAGDVLEQVGYGGDRSSVVLVDGDGAFQHSDAAWRTLRLLPWPWRAGAVMRFIPRPLRDLAYRFIARNRFRIFGYSDVCALRSALPRDQLQRLLE
jgi:predicted DCC family thiol-disulfide oxidoreductase YuxK